MVFKTHSNWLWFVCLRWVWLIRDLVKERLLCQKTVSALPSLLCFNGVVRFSIKVPRHVLGGKTGLQNTLKLTVVCLFVFLLVCLRWVWLIRDLVKKGFLCQESLHKLSFSNFHIKYNLFISLPASKSPSQIFCSLEASSHGLTILFKSNF